MQVGKCSGESTSKHFTITALLLIIELWKRLYLLISIEPLLLKAEALDLVEVEACLKGDDVVGSDAGHCLVGGVACCVEGQSSLSWYQLDLSLVGAELPQHISTGVRIEPTAAAAAAAV